MTRPGLSIAVALILSAAAVGSPGESVAVTSKGRIAFVGANGRAIFVMNGEGGARMRLARGSGALAWSPDGTKIIADGLLSVSVSDRSARRLTRPKASYPEYDWGAAWSPDGRRITFNRTMDIDNSICVIAADGGAFRRLTPIGKYLPNYSPSFSRDGRTIAYIGTGGVWVMDADGSGKRRLAAAKFPSHGVPGPAWSPDGRWIAFTSDDEVWVTRSDGTQRRRLFGDPHRSTEDISWSPGSRRLAFAHGDGDWEIFVVNADGSGLRNITNNRRVQDEDPSWSPDGQSIAFVSDRDGNAEIYVMRADGRDQRNLSKAPGQDYGPVWSTPRR